MVHPLPVDENTTYNEQSATKSESELSKYNVQKSQHSSDLIIS